MSEWPLRVADQDKTGAEKVVSDLEEFFDIIDRYFLDSSKLQYCYAFAHTGTHSDGRSTGQQLEGWFKGELIYLFSELQKKQCIVNWKSEVKEFPGSRIDFWVEINDQLPRLYLELKALYLGLQPGPTLVDPGYYFDLNRYAGIDVEKLSRVLQKYASMSKDVACACLYFVYPFPENEALGMQGKWEEKRDEFCNSMRTNGIDINETTQLDIVRYAPDLYISRLNVQLSSSQ